MKDYTKYRLNIKKSPHDARDFKFRAIYAPVSLPTKFSNRPYMLPARDQEDTPECAAFAGSSAQQGRDTREYGLDEYLSPQFIYNHREDPQEEGMYNRDLMKILQSKGVCIERLYRFRSSDTPSQAAYENALNHRSDNYAAIDYIEELKQALYIKGPCIMAVPVYNYTERMWYQFPGEEFLGGHDMLVTGYYDEHRAFEILNSWGQDFGNDGYVYMSYDDFSLAWEFWSNVDLPSRPTTTEAPTTTAAPEPDKEPWINRYWWVLVIAVLAIGTFIGLISYIW